MHLAIALFTILSVWLWADLKGWKQYHPTMLYITAAGFLYEYLSQDYYLWVFHSDLLPTQIIVILYALVTMPLSIFLYLSRYPNKTRVRQFIYIVQWISVYGFFEWVLHMTGRITYQHEWNFGNSLLFDAMMFPMLRLHHVKPLWSYPISVLIASLLMYWFRVPFHQ